MWITKKSDIQSIQVSMYPKKTDIHLSKYPCIQLSMISKYPLIQVSKKKSVSKISKYPDIRKKWYPLIPILELVRLLWIKVNLVWIPEVEIQFTYTISWKHTLLWIIPAILIILSSCYKAVLWSFVIFNPPSCFGLIDEKSRLS